jgi:hypothetical protein
MIWVVLTLVALAYVMVFALMKAAALSDREPEAPVDIPLPVRSRPKPHDWEESEDFDG